MRRTFKVDGMSCVNCARTIEIALRRKEGVMDVEVSFELGRVRVDFDEGRISEEEIVKTIETLGYRVIEEEGNSKETAVLLISLTSALLITFLMFKPVPYGSYVQLLLSTLVQVVGGWKFYRGAIVSLLRGSAGMDVLVALGTTGSYLYSLLAFLRFIPGDPFFETNAYLISFVRTGRFIEERAKRRATALLRRMLGAQHSEVTVLEGGREVRKNVREVRRGEVVLLRGGDMILVDGKVIKGEAYVSEAVVTGEPEPVVKRVGDKVLSGSVVEDGMLEVEVEAIYESSYLSNIGKLIDRALSDKPRVQRLADRVSHYFVQAVLAVALITFLVWMLKTSDLQTSVRFALAVLVISCPCALGIATPLAVAVGMSKALSMGVLIKKPSALEVFQKVNLLVFDKTGTLTEGRFEVVKAEIRCPEAVDLAYSMERRSNHPVARAIEKYAKDRGAKEVPLEDCREIKGKGVYCGELFIGEEAAGNGAFKAVALKRKEETLAVFFLRDAVREEAGQVIEEIKQLGIRTFLLSGDRADITEKVAKELGIDGFMAEVSPQDKREEIRRLQSEGYVVAMVGDGINDAPALAQADLSFAVAHGTDITKQVGDVVLLPGVKALPSAFRLGRAINAKIKQNLLWAFVYNVLGIPAAAGLFYKMGVYLKPELAGLMMAISSLSVVFNTLTLSRRRF